MEYWPLPGAFRTAYNQTLQSSATLSFAPQTHTGAPAGWNTYDSDMKTKGTWTAQVSTWSPPANTLYSGSFGLSIAPGGAVTWYYRGAAAPTGKYAVSAAGKTFNTTAPTSGTWYALSI